MAAAMKERWCAFSRSMSVLSKYGASIGSPSTRT